MKKILLIITLTGAICATSYAQELPGDCFIPEDERQSSCDINTNPCPSGQLCAGSPVAPPPGQQPKGGTCVKFDNNDPKTNKAQCVPSSAQGPGGNICPGVPSPCEDPNTHRSMRDASGNIIPPTCVNGAWTCKEKKPDCGKCCSPNAEAQAMPAYRMPMAPIVQQQQRTPTWTIREYMRRPAPVFEMRANVLDIAWDWLFGK